MAISTMLPLGFALANLWLAAANPFLSAQHQDVADQVEARAVEKMLLDELTNSANAARRSAMEEKLRPIFAALPKNALGQLEPPTVRYALHRYFVQEYGWYVKGLDPAGDSWNVSSPSSITKDRVPSYVQALLEKRLHGRGMDIADLTIYAATLVDLIEKEVEIDLGKIYGALSLPIGGYVTPEELDSAMRAYLGKFILGGAEPVRHKSDIQYIEKELSEIYADWPETIMWLLDQRLSVDHSQQSRRNPFENQEVPFDRAVATTQAVMHNIVSLAKLECSVLKNNLLDVEYEGTGRVWLHDFYASESHQMKEKIDYLRNLGVLEEVEGREPMVVITNYMASQSNCLAESSYYASCCVDECEGLLGHLERTLAAPVVPAARIAEVVAALPSATVDAPRNLSFSLLHRLGQISDHHGGNVPLHGRLFLQWMHHAYPRECPYPLPSGVVKPLSQDDWMDKTGMDEVIATQEEIKRHTAGARFRQSENPEVPELPWDLMEDLSVGRHVVPDAHTGTPSLLTAGVVVVALASFVVSGLGASRALVGTGGQKGKIHSV